MLTLISAVANGGTVIKPLIAKRVEDLDHKILEEYPTKEISTVPISSETLGELRQALLGVVKDDSGTGRAARVDGLQIAGKTGTAQVIGLKGGERQRTQEMAYRFRDHAWFVAYVPADTPFAVVVLVEHGGHGGSAAAPLAREMIKRYFHHSLGGK